MNQDQFLAKYMKYINKLDGLLILVGLFLLWIFRIDIMVIVSSIFTIIYLILTKRINLFKHYLVSVAIGSIWFFIVRNQYGYNQDLLVVANLNIFPLIAWTLGLFMAYMLYREFTFRKGIKGFRKKFIIFSALYVFSLIIMETIAYHTFMIQNIATSAYPGLPICNCIHAPLWMQIGYLSLGSVYFLVFYALGLENPNQKSILEKAVAYVKKKFRKITA